MPEALPVVTLYGRPGCHLCDAALTILQSLARRHRFRIETVNIESDEALLRRYLVEIPVVVLEGQELARAPIVPSVLERHLRAALTARSTA